VPRSMPQKRRKVRHDGGSYRLVPLAPALRGVIDRREGVPKIVDAQAFEPGAPVDAERDEQFARVGGFGRRGIDQAAAPLSLFRRRVGLSANRESSRGLRPLELAVHEWIGLAAYHRAGKIKLGFLRGAAVFGWPRALWK
jgi:hypothetical protein